MVVILLTGGVDAGWFRATSTAKPIVILWALVPIRLTLQSWPWSAAGAIATARAARDRVRAIAARVPHAVADAVFAFAVTRIAVDAVAFLVNVLYPAERTRPFGLPFEAARLVEPYAAWDAGWYFVVATRGYYYAPDGQSSIAFFPLYPMAMRLLAWPFGSDAAVWIAGIVISSSASLAGLIALHRFTEQTCGDRDTARRAVLFAAVFPFSFFLSRVYPEGLFFLLTVLAVSAASRSRWWAAGLCGALAALTRPQGILIAVPLVMMAWAPIGRPWGQAPWQQLRTAIATPATGPAPFARFAALAPIPLAFLAFNVYIGSLAGDANAFLASEARWGYSLGHPPWEQLAGLIARLQRYGLHDYFATSNLAAYRLFHGATALFLLAMIPAVFVRLGAPLGAYVLVSLLVPLSGNALEGIGRYAAVLFPVFMTLATVKSPRFHEAWLIVSALFLALFAGLFATWRPIY